MSDDTQTKTADEIRDDIEQTREQLGDTVEQLGAKTDVKARANAKVEEVKTSVATGKVAQNRLPIGIALGALLVVGYLIRRRTAG